MSSTYVGVTYTNPNIQLDISYNQPQVNLEVNTSNITASGTNTYTISSLAAMLSLPASKGDIAIRTDEGKSYRLVAIPATSEDNWAVISSPTSGSSLYALETWTATSGQTIFSFPSTITRPDLSQFYVNGVKYKYGSDYTFNTLSSTLIWSGIRLEPTDDIQLYYL